MARVRGVMATATRSGSSMSVAGSTSTKTGRAPTWSAAVAEATNENAGVTTSASGPMPSASRRSLSASDPEADADRVADAQVLRALGLERLALRAQDEAAAPQHAAKRRLDFRLEARVLTGQVELRDLHCRPAKARPKPYWPSSSRLMVIRNSSSSTRSTKDAVMPQHCSRKSTSMRFSMTVPVSTL